MSSLDIVIGANFGDEGKGLITAYLTNKYVSKESGLVLNVLNNGGAQRGHSVDYDESHRHIYKHFGSGTLHGADVCFDKDYIINPVIYSQEYDDLCNKFRKSFGKKDYFTYAFNLNRRIHYNHYCYWTTLYDMALNYCVQRHTKLNDSCGYGIWYTRKRSEEERKSDKWLSIRDFALAVIDPIETNKVVNPYLDQVRDYSIHSLENDFEFKPDNEDYKIFEEADKGRKHFMFDCLRFISSAKESYILNDIIYDTYNYVIVEKGQGLGLDEINGYEYNTSSRTGINNFDFEHFDYININYVTRSYLTRHGIGKMYLDDKNRSLDTTFEDKTNIPNQYQGTLRFGQLEINEMLDRIKKDLKSIDDIRYKINVNLFITHMNEINLDINLLKNSKVFDNIYISDSPYIESIKLA